MRKTEKSYFTFLSHPSILVRMALGFFFCCHALNSFAANPEACNNYIAYKTIDIPFFDGIGDEDFWANCPWYAIDQVWLPYNNDVNYPDATKEGSSKPINGENDFSGKFKLAWNEDENMLYLLAVITDDVFVSGYAGTGSYSVYDVLEIFIDEDRSGGEHELDLGNSVAANAFSYHINAFPYEEGDVQTYMSAMDIAGKKGDIVNYRNHFPYFSLSKEGNIYTYELAMKLYRGESGIAYDTEAANEYEVKLYEGKVSGFSLAYCDNDDPNDLSRDHFIGSSYLPAGKNNSNYQNADLFGELLFEGEYKTNAIEEDIEVVSHDMQFRLYPNPAKDYIRLTSKNQISSNIRIHLLGTDGSKLSSLFNGKINDQDINIPLSGIPPGIYFISIETNNDTKLMKLIIN